MDRRPEKISALTGIEPRPCRLVGLVVERSTDWATWSHAGNKLCYSKGSKQMKNYPINTPLLSLLKFEWCRPLPPVFRTSRVYWDTNNSQLNPPGVVSRLARVAHHPIPSHYTRWWWWRLHVTGNFAGSCWSTQPILSVENVHVKIGLYKQDEIKQ